MTARVLTGLPSRVQVAVGAEDGAQATLMNGGQWRESGDGIERQAEAYVKRWSLLPDGSNAKMDGLPQAWAAEQVEERTGS